MSFYLDASVIVPTLVEERSSEALDAFLSAPNGALIVSDLAATEVVSALSRLVRMQFLTVDAANDRLRAFDAWRVTATAGMDFQPSDFRLADLFVRRFDLGLRAPDALHAAACRRGDHRLVTLDQRLAAAAEAVGLGVDRPA